MDSMELFNKYYNPIAQEVDKYAEELINEANGDYDFVAKWIENAYKLALGTDDGARAQFIKKVANTMEERVGRIAFDYETGKYRTEQDMGIDTQRVNQARDLALKRLSEDEATTREQMSRESGAQRQATAESLSERGLLSGKLGSESGLEGRNVQEMETALADKLGAFERTLGRNRTDITTQANQNLADINKTGNRALEDLTTTARRGSIDEQVARDKGIDQAQRLKDKAVAAAERERYAGKEAAKKYASIYGSSTI